MSTIKGIFEPFYKYVKQQLGTRKWILSNPSNAMITEEGNITDNYDDSTTKTLDLNRQGKQTWIKSVKRNIDGKNTVFKLSSNEEIEAFNKKYNDNLNPLPPTVDGRAFWTYTTEKQCTVRMMSGVNLVDSVSEDLLEDHEKNYVGNSLAQIWVLESGTQISNGGIAGGFEGNSGNVGLDEDYIVKNSSYGNKVYRANADNDFGVVPIPGIIDAEIKTKTSDGSLREAIVNFRCFNKRQLEILELLYMRPGFPVLVEWGWDPYVSNNYQRESNNFDVKSKFFDEKSNIEEINKEIRKNKSLSGGNYDGFLGQCKNFSFKAREDGGYDCTTEIIAAGEILESLKGKKIILDKPTIGRADGREDQEALIGDEFLFHLKAIKENLNSAGDQAFLKYFGTTNHRKIDYRDFSMPGIGSNPEGERYFGHRAPGGYDLVKAWNGTSQHVTLMTMNASEQRQWVINRLTNEGYEQWEIDRIFGSGGLISKGVTKEEIIIDPVTKEIFYIRELNKQNPNFKERFSGVVNLIRKITKNKWEERYYDGEKSVGLGFDSKSGKFGGEWYNIRGQGIDAILGGTIIRQVVRFDEKGSNFDLLGGFRSSTKQMLEDNYGYKAYSTDAIESDSGYRKNIFVRWDLLCQMINKFSTEEYQPGRPLVKLDYLEKNKMSYNPSLGKSFDLNEVQNIKEGNDADKLAEYIDERFQFNINENGDEIPVRYLTYSSADTRKLTHHFQSVNNLVGNSYDERVCIMPHQDVLGDMITANEFQSNPYDDGQGTTYYDEDFTDYIIRGNRSKDSARFNQTYDTTQGFFDLTDYWTSVKDSNTDLIDAPKNSIGYVLFNLDYVINEYVSMRLETTKTDEGETTYTRLNKNFNMHDFIKRIWDGVNDATGNYYDFTLITEHERPNVAKIIDKTLSGTQYLNPDDLFEFNPQGLESVCRDIYFDSAITNDMANMISVAAQTPKASSDLVTQTFKKFSENIQSRWSTSLHDKNEEESEADYLKELYLQDLKRFKKLYYSLDKFTVNFNNNFFGANQINYSGYGIVSSTLSPSTAKMYAEELEELANSIYERYPEKTDGNLNDGIQTPNYCGMYMHKASLRKSAIIPLNVNLRLDGIAGIIPLNVFKINPEKLPKGYQRKDVAFIVKSESQKITSGQDWTTDLTGQLVLLDINPNLGENTIDIEDLVFVDGIPVEEKLEMVNPYKGFYATNSTWPIRNDGRHHAGLDLNLPNGTELYAPRDGKIWDATWFGGDQNQFNHWAYESGGTGYGNMICMEFTDPLTAITHTYGPNPTGKPVARACFAHLQRIDVTPGQIVTQKQLIGLSDSTGTVTGAHLHYEVGTEDLMTLDWRLGYGETVGLEKKRARNENAHVQPLLVLDEKCQQFQTEKCTWT